MFVRTERLSLRRSWNVGFRGEGLRLSNSWFKSEWTDDLRFGLLRTDYLS